MPRQKRGEMRSNEKDDLKKNLMTKLAARVITYPGTRPQKSPSQISEKGVGLNTLGEWVGGKWEKARMVFNLRATEKTQPIKKERLDMFGVIENVVGQISRIRKHCGAYLRMEKSQLIRYTTNVEQRRNRYYP